MSALVGEGPSNQRPSLVNSWWLHLPGTTDTRAALSLLLFVVVVLVFVVIVVVARYCAVPPCSTCRVSDWRHRRRYLIHHPGICAGTCLFWPRSSGDRSELRNGGREEGGVQPQRSWVGGEAERNSRAREIDRCSGEMVNSA